MNKLGFYTINDSTFEISEFIRTNVSGLARLGPLEGEIKIQIGPCDGVLGVSNTGPQMAIFYNRSVLEQFAECGLEYALGRTWGLVAAGLRMLVIQDGNILKDDLCPSSSLREKGYGAALNMIVATYVSANLDENDARVLADCTFVSSCFVEYLMYGKADIDTNKAASILFEMKRSNWRRIVRTL